MAELLLFPGAEALSRELTIVGKVDRGLAKGREVHQWTDGEMTLYTLSGVLSLATFDDLAQRVRNEREAFEQLSFKEQIRMRSELVSKKGFADSPILQYPHFFSQEKLAAQFALGNIREV